jgi:plastocyanin
MSCGVLGGLLLAFTCGPAFPAPDAAIEAAVTDDKGKPVEDAVVYVVSLPRAETRRDDATMDQQDQEFIPYVLPIDTQTAVRFPNRDNIRHHVYSVSPAKKFELPLYSGTPAHPVVFDKPGVVVLGCNIHDWMLAYVFVLPTPYFAKTGPDGKARIAELSPGSHEVRVWHPRMRESTEKTGQQAAASPTAAGQVTFTVTFKREWRVPRTPGRYGGAGPQG